jgi:hypothetical protein
MKIWSSNYINVIKAIIPKEYFLCLCLGPSWWPSLENIDNDTLIKDVSCSEIINK